MLEFIFMLTRDDQTVPDALEVYDTLHDTGLHPRRSAPWSYPVADADGQHGWVHQDVERRMVNALRRLGGCSDCSAVQAAPTPPKSREKT